MDGYEENEAAVAAAAAAVEVLSEGEDEEEEEKDDDDDDDDNTGSGNSHDFSSYDLTDRDQVLRAVRDECTDDAEYGLLMKFCRTHLRSTYALDIHGYVDDADSDDSSVDYVTENIKDIVEFFLPKPRVFVKDKFECNDETVMRDCFETDILEYIDLYLKMTDNNNDKLDFDPMEEILCASLMDFFKIKLQRLNNLSKHIKDNKCSDVITAVQKSSRGLIELQRSKIILKKLESVLLTEYSGLSEQFNDCYDELLFLYNKNRTNMLAEPNSHDLYYFEPSGIGTIRREDDYVRRIMTKVKTNFTYKLSFIDGIILVLLYARIGLDLNARYDDFCSDDLMGCCTTDIAGRIVSLDIHPSYINNDMEVEEYEEYNLPGVVVLLQSLRHLQFTGCCSFHDGDYLSLLPHLEEIEVSFTRIHLSQVGLPLGTKPLPQVTKISFHSCEWLGSAELLPESDFFVWLKSKFPNLKALETFNDHVDDRGRFGDILLDALLHNDMCFQDKLEILGVSVCRSSQHTEKILDSGTLSKFKNLQRVNLRSNGICNFNSISVTSTTSLLPRTLYTVDLSHNPIMKNPSDKMALLKYLETNSGIYNLGISYEVTDYHPDIKYVLLINCARRSFIDHSSTVLPSLLPKYLEQVYKKSDAIYAENSHFRGKKDSTGIYHLLRQNLPAVIGSRLYPRSTVVERKSKKRKLSKRKVL